MKFQLKSLILGSNHHSMKSILGTKEWLDSRIGLLPLNKDFFHLLNDDLTIEMDFSH